MAAPGMNATEQADFLAGLKEVIESWKKLDCVEIGPEADILITRMEDEHWGVEICMDFYCGRPDRNQTAPRGRNPFRRMFWTSLPSRAQRRQLTAAFRKFGERFEAASLRTRRCGLDKLWSGFASRCFQVHLTFRMRQKPAAEEAVGSRAGKGSSRYYMPRTLWQR